MKEPRNFLLIGRAGCGKGTQAELLLKYMEKNCYGKTSYIYVGSALRSFINDNNSLTSKLAGKIMEKGDMEPSFLAVWALANNFIEKINENANIISDGFPRNLTEATIIDEAILFYDLKNVFPVFIETSRDWSKEKLLKRKRNDDTEEAIKRRLDYFEEFVTPVIDYYQNKSKYKLVRVNGEQGIEKVHEEIIDKCFK
ncbi:MAG: nucleoside monophosphate kinase [Candidatus Pacebacteria bacterium]|nr:nucleoside monophosphate kinase [Candidatus Paceibacterota bacterium]NUQ57187.1 nucleoside monophosphate kinase [Candidatus Paceibacter sp.]